MEWLPRFLSPSDDDDETEIYSNETHTSLWHSNKNTGNATSGGFVEVFPRNHTATTTITPTMNPSMPNATAAANDFFASSSAFLSTQWPMLVLVGLVIVCTVLLCYMTLPILWQWLHRTVSHTLSHSTSRVQRRCETIEGWLISKRVRLHCELCDQLQRCGSHETTTDNSSGENATITATRKQQQQQLGEKLPHIQLATSYDTAETVLIDADDDDVEQQQHPGLGDDMPCNCNSSSSSSSSNSSTHSSRAQHECPVCMECFVENDIVSWSPCFMGCNHVFHHTCIKQWLMYHEGCPYCRVTMLPVDQDATVDDNSNGALVVASQSPLSHATEFLPSSSSPAQPTTTNEEPNNTAATTTNNETTTNSSWLARNKQQWTIPQLTALAELRAQRVLTTYYCLEEGLVTLKHPPHFCCCSNVKALNSTTNNAAAVPSATSEESSNSSGKSGGGSTNKKLLVAMQRFVGTGVTQTELAKLRESDGKLCHSSSNEDIVVSIVPSNSATETTTTSADIPINHGNDHSLNDNNPMDDSDPTTLEIALNGGIHHSGSESAAIEISSPDINNGIRNFDRHHADADVELCLIQLSVLSSNEDNCRELSVERRRRQQPRGTFQTTRGDTNACL